MRMSKTHYEVRPSHATCIWLGLAKRAGPPRPAEKRDGGQAGPQKKWGGTLARPTPIAGWQANLPNPPKTKKMRVEVVGWPA